MNDRTRLSPYLLINITVLLLCCILLIIAVNKVTSDKIADNRLQAAMKIFDDIIPYEYTNDIFNDSIEVIDPGYLGTTRPVSIHRIRYENTPLGVIIHPVIADGYGSDIELAVGISKQGVVTGVRVISEDETEGLGDQINQGKTDWIRMFTGKSLEEPPRDEWRVKSEGGYFDEISGATITSRSVINSVSKALVFHNTAGERLYSQ